VLIAWMPMRTVRRMSSSVANPRPVFVATIALLLAFAFLGMRGIWDPDEGRYTNVALVMLDSGDWLSPMRNEATGHWTKPPMTYWLVASSVALFGQSAWAARLPVALAFLACAWFAGAIARTLVPGSGHRAALVFVTMVAPFGAAQLVTTDFLLAAAGAAAMYAYVRSRFGPQPDVRWVPAMWAAFGVAFLIKGPPGLLPLMAIAVFGWCVPAAGPARWRWHVGGALIAMGIALPWYVAVVLRHEGLLAYFLGAEVLDRFASDRFDRNGEWHGWAKVYGPMLLLGTLPWTPALLGWMRTWPGRLRAWCSPAVRRAQGAQVLLVAWIGLPLLVFCIARSRLPLYVLPLFVPIAIGIALHARNAWPRWPWMLAWVGALLVARFVVAQATPLQDASAWAEGIRARAGTASKVVFVDDTPRWGLHLHLDAQVERRTLGVHEASRFGRRYDGTLETLLADSALEDVVFVARMTTWDEVRARIRARGFEAHPLGAPYAGRRIFLVQPTR
jgi:4-amino-4-deoxy-L-arabinose transferase-like glycosyltransferase